MIIGTSPNGVFKVDTDTEKVEWLLKGNFFGIDRIKSITYLTQDFVVYLAKRNEKGYTTLLEYNYEEKEILQEFYLLVQDVHQICRFTGTPVVCLTNTKNNIVTGLYHNSYNRCMTAKFISILNNTKTEIVQGKDINHINALYYNSEIDRFYIGLNNKGLFESQVLIKHNVSSDNINNEMITLSGVYHSHDLEPYNDDILISASHQGFVYSLNKKEPLFYTGDVWTRGICVSKQGVWVGYSAVSPRSSRQDPTLKNSINLFSHDDFKHIKQIEIPRAGQICDMLYIPKDEFMQNITER